MGMNMEKSKRGMASIYVIAGTVFIGIIFSVIEYLGKSEGLELRTFMQIIKGLWLWLVTPLSVIFSGGALLKPFMDEKHRGLKALRIVLMVLAVAVTLFVGFVRGIFYTFTSEMVTEKTDENGYIVGTYADFLSETKRAVYEPVYGIFRKPFEGWSSQELTERLREKYSGNIELVREKNNGIYLFQAPDPDMKGAYIYFHAKSNYDMTNDFAYRVMQNQAMRLWAAKGRFAGLYADGEICALDGDENIYKEIRLGNYGTVDSTSYIEEEISLHELLQDFQLYVYCSGSEEDIAACAGDLADWYLYLVRCPYICDAAGSIGADFYDSVEHVVVGDRESSFRLYAYGDIEGDIEAAMNAGAGVELNWNAVQEKLKARLGSQYENDRARRKEIEDTLQSGNQGTAKEQGENAGSTVPDNSVYDAYMDDYAKNYEVECVPGDGQLRYRFVVLDAACGSRAYGVIRSEDGGESWSMWSSRPFDNDMGGGIDAVFLDEKFGFATLSHNGGDSADLYVTADGGVSYTMAVMENYIVTLDDGYTYTPYDFPQMPYEDDGAVWVLCGQGADGDYDGGDRKLARYRSEDGGYTFSFVDFVENEDWE